MLLPPEATTCPGLLSMKLKEAPYDVKKFFRGGHSAARGGEV